MLTVMKFGGSSMASPEAFERVVDIITSTEGDKVIVVSAISGVTNFLIEVAENENVNYEEVLKMFSEKHIAIAEQMFDEVQMKQFLKEYSVRMASFEKALRSDRTDPFYHDAITSSGERFSSLILSHVLKSKKE